MKLWKKLWRVLCFAARIINTIEDVYNDIKETFFSDEPEKPENSEK